MFRRRIKLPIDANLFTTLLSGTQSGIATTAAIVAGLATGTDDRQLVLVSAFVAFVVQGFNAAMNHITIAHVDDEIEDSPEKYRLTGPVGEAALQFLMHLITSIAVLTPIVFVTNLQRALITSILIALVLLFFIGLYVGYVVKHAPIRNGVENAILGALVIIAGLSAGIFLN